MRTIQVLSGVLFTVLALAAFFKTAYVENAYQIIIRLRQDNLLFNAFFLFVGIVLLYFLYRFFTRWKYGPEILLVLSVIWVFCASLLWTYFSKSGPASDCGSVYYAAKQFARNDFSALAYRDSYFSVYPFQLGLASFYELIFRLAGSNNFHILQGVNAICLSVCVLSQYGLCKQLFSNKKVRLYCLLLTDFCIPFIMYGSYIYGEIPSFAFILFGSWMLHLFLSSFLPKPVPEPSCGELSTSEKKGKKEHVLLTRILTGLLGFVSIVASVWVRKNSLIFLIALGIIVILHLILYRHLLSGKCKLFLAAYFVAMFVLSLQIIPMVQQMYANRSGTEINKGVPSSTYLAMGLMEADSGPGGYNGYNFETFTVAADYDHDKASAIGMEDYKERLSHFLSHPGYALSFLSTKFLNQWLNVGWAIFDSIYVPFGERLPIIESCFSGSLYHVLVNYMSGYQMILYILVAFGLLYASFFQESRCHLRCLITDDSQPFYYLFLLTAIGGAVFYLFWEASGRYVLPYAIFVLPHAAYGMCMIDEWISRQLMIRAIRKGLSL